jgi:hypothetical protein
MKIYDTAALYGQNMSDEQQSKLMEFYRDLDSIWIHPSQQRPKSGSFEADFHQIAWYGILAQKK